MITCGVSPDPACHPVPVLRGRHWARMGLPPEARLGWRRLRISIVLPLGLPPMRPCEDLDMTGEPAEIVPETKDWTFVIRQRCHECGFGPERIAARDVGQRLRMTIPRWSEALARPDAAVRPADHVWSPLEYGCHVRDTCQIFGERLQLMLTQDDPEFANWDQDQTAVEDRYWAQDPQVVAAQYAETAAATASAFETVQESQWSRTGRRSNGSVFTIESFAIYFLHDIDHHLHDVDA